MKVENPLFQEYKLQCTFPGCVGGQVVEQPTSAGLKLGDIVPMDPSNHLYGKCPKCHRYQLKVVKAPKPAKPQPPKGFTSIPEK